MDYLYMPMWIDLLGELCGIATRVVGPPYENRLRSTALQATNCDSGFTDDKEEAFSSLVYFVLL